MAIGGCEVSYRFFQNLYTALPEVLIFYKHNESEFQPISVQ